MVPLSAFGSGEWTYGAPKLTRFDGNSSLEIKGEAAQGISSGEALNQISKLAESLPSGIGLEWTGLDCLLDFNHYRVLRIGRLYENWAVDAAAFELITCSYQWAPYMKAGPYRWRLS